MAFCNLHLKNYRCIISLLRQIYPQIPGEIEVHLIYETRFPAIAGTMWRFSEFRLCLCRCIVSKEVNDMYRSREQIAYRIRDCREADGLTREAFEELSGVSSKFLYELETAQKDMTVSTLLKICTALDRTPDELLLAREAEDPDEALLSRLSRLDTAQKQLLLGFADVMLRQTPASS